jgi:phosphoglycolate phosphatase
LTQARIAILDFDGTLSLIRSGWPAVMQSMVAEVLPGFTPTDGDFIWRLAGKETIYQMVALAGEVARRGGTPLNPAIYKQQFLARLAAVTGSRMEELRRGDGPPDRYLVPDARAMLEALRARGLRLYLASGTDEAQLKEEAALLDIARYFDGGIFGAREGPASFGKHELIQSLLPALLVVFGDGPVEIEEARRAGATAVGLATDEPGCQKIDERKRRLLIEAGADYIIPNFLGRDDLLPLLFGSRFPMFDRSRLVVKPLAERVHDLTLANWLALDDATPPFSHPDLATVAGRLVEARARGAARILMMGAHVLRAGVSRYLIEMMERGDLTHLAMNGAGPIHDWELALIGATTESVARYIQTGEFGLWDETGRMNEAIVQGAKAGLGLGEAIGRAILDGPFPH